MTLILKLDLDIVKMYTKNEVSMSTASKVIAQTDTHTHTRRKHYAGGNNIKVQNQLWVPFISLKKKGQMKFFCNVGPNPSTLPFLHLSFCKGEFVLTLLFFLM